MTTRIALIGATGLVGQEFLKVIYEFPLESIEVVKVASYARPQDHVISFDQMLSEFSSFSFFVNAADAEQSKTVASLLKSPQRLIDNSSAFRMDQDVPLLVPEINAHALSQESKVLANPNCTAALLCMTLAPLKKWGLKRVVVSTYQAASGAGLKALDELKAQIKSYSQNPEVTLKSEVFPFPLFLNVMSHNTSVRQESEGLGYNDEEWKVICETRKILDLPDLALSATCMRVPVLRAHTETVTVDLEKDFTMSDLKEALTQFSGLKWQNIEDKKHFPMPLDAENKNEVFVGRLRRDPFLKNTVHFLLSGDQLRKGAAWNAFQILKLCLDRS